LADGAQSADLYEILVFVTERLADYKVPETLEIVDKIPRNTLGKIDRQLLLSMISESRSRDTGLSLGKREFQSGGSDLTILTHSASNVACRGSLG
jgi:hypothetical protein